MSEANVMTIAAADLGAPGPASPEACAGVAIRLMGQAAGAGFRMTSLALDVASQALTDGRVKVAYQVDKRSRSIVFVSVDARLDGILVFAAQGLFSRQG
jgi:hypothetical protein